MKTLFLTPDNGVWASSRIRAAYVSAHMQDATWMPLEDFLMEWDRPEADNYIFVKLGAPQAMAGLKTLGKRIFWDLCDPSWWWKPDECRQVAGLVDGIVTSNTALSRDLSNFLNGQEVHTIPDRIDLSRFTARRTVHEPKDTVSFVWFGAAQNRIALFGAINSLWRLYANGHNITLTILDDHPEQLWLHEPPIPILYELWDNERECELIAKHDIAILPLYPGEWGKVKSNNKRLTAWAAGLAVTDGQKYDGLLHLVQSEDARMQNAEAGIKTVYGYYRVEQSAQEWESLLCHS